MKINLSIKIISVYLSGVALAFSAYAQGPARDELLRILEKEMNREKEGFAIVSQPPYFIDYRVNDMEVTIIHSSFGSLTQSFKDRTRLLNTHVRVGDYEVDNTHPVEHRRENAGFDGRDFRDNVLPLDDNNEAIRYTLWHSTQNHYKRALENYKTVKNSSKVPSSEKAPADFSREPVEHFFDPPFEKSDNSFSKSVWEEKTRQYSRIFLANPDIVVAEVSLQLSRERKYFVSSEGASVVQNFSYAYLNISASIRADDGEIVPLHRSYFTPSPDGLPDDEVIKRDVNAMIIVLEKLKKAPLADPYTGPALLEAPVAGVFFHEIFGHRVEGHRLRDEQDGQTFKAKVNERILPENIDVFFDPTLKQFEGKYLNGTYAYDDEGVRSRRVNVVEKGVLKTFLMSRSPLGNIATSNGHGRASAGASPVSRQSNLFVDTAKPRSAGDLRQMLIKECQKQKKEYGYLFKDVVGGFTLTGRFTPNAFNIFPTEVYRVYVNERPDELVRGVDLIGTPLAMFAEIAAVGNTHDIFTGFCGAESGNVPVSAVSPALFVRRIETQKKPRSKVESTLLPTPKAADN